MTDKKEWTEKDKIIADYSDHDPDEWEEIKKAMYEETKKKLKSMKLAVVQSVLEKQKGRKSKLRIPLNNKWRRDAVIKSTLDER